MQLQLGGEQNRHAHRVGRQCLRQCVYHGYRHYDAADTTPTTTVVKTETVDAGAELARSGHIDWNGRNGAAPLSRLYGEYYAQIMLQVNLDDDHGMGAGSPQRHLSSNHRRRVSPWLLPLPSVTGETPSDNVTAMLDLDGARCYRHRCEFNGSAIHSDPDGGDIQSYTWDFGDDSTDRQRLSSQSHGVTPTAPPVAYTVKLRVTDNEGHTTPDGTGGHRNGNGGPQD